MFKKILIANRGEIACRITQTAHKLGCKVVAVYSEADAKALHVEMADEAYCIGGAQPSGSYLRGEAIIDVALATGAEAIHPGYGFLSENPEFVEAVGKAGLVFIGPSASAIRAMGLKDAAKALMEKAGVPVVPGYHGDNQEPEHLRQAAQEIGYPVLIKAVAGGGGKGMRRVDSDAQFSDALASAQAEARGAFGNADVLIEKYIEQPRHIEMQVFGDGTRAIHLFERDCSLQRRHQKVIEEAPAPGMSDAVRAAMGQAAVRAAEAIGYSGAGTIEFIVDGANGLREDGFWFMEMNTRLQVEHPVTEAITGIDLVEWQLRVASGEPLPLTQDDISIEGHAFEARLYAEDVPKGFLPATGKLDEVTFSNLARNDTGVRSGDVISPFYDPMIAKVITHDKTRSAALNRLKRALGETEVVGSVTNLAFLGALCDNADFVAERMDTGLIDRDLDSLIAQPSVTIDVVAAATLAATRSDQIDPIGFHLWEPLWQDIEFRVDEEQFKLRYRYEGQSLHIEWNDKSVEVYLSNSNARLDGRNLAKAVVHGAKVTVLSNPSVGLLRIDPLDRIGDGSAQGNAILSPMPGLIRKVAVEKGQAVKEGDTLIILEAMKMEHTLVASKDAIIEAVYCSEGEQVEAGATLVAFAE